MGSDQMLTVEENYVGYKPQLLAGVDVADSVKGFFYDQNRQYYGQTTPVAEDDDHYDLAADASAGRKPWKLRRNAQRFDDGNPQGASLECRLYLESKTPSRQSGLLIES